MPKGFTGIRLLLVFVAVNTILFGMLLTSMTSAHPWLGYVLPGRFETGVNASGYWVFFSLVLLVNVALLSFYTLSCHSLVSAATTGAETSRLLARN